MTANRFRSRAGITLTEILISIMIMGVGLVSLATLFPLGLVRLRQANQLDRSSFLVESAIADLGSRDLLNKSTFLNSWYGGLVNGVPYDPFVRDTPLGAVGTEVTSSLGGGGLPVCYDPLLRSVAEAFPALPAAYYNPYLPNALLANNPAGNHPRELRFGAGVVPNGASAVSFLRNDPSGGAPSAHGLQRLSNFLPYTAATITWPLTYNSPTLSPAGSRDVAAECFASPDDIVFHENGASPTAPWDPIGNAFSTAATNSPPRMTIPQLTAGGQTMNDWKFTWFFTGRQTDMLNGSVFDGDVVICDGRPLAEELRTSPFNASDTAWVAAGEYVMEAIFGYSNTVFPTTGGYSVGSDRTVLLRWPSTMPDPEIKVGNWIADVTYERIATTSAARLGTAAAVAGTNTNIPVYPMQRCHWYQIAKRTDIMVEDASMTAPVSSGYRRMVVYLTSPVKSKTLFLPGKDAVFLNVALFMPSVVNVFPRTVFSRNTK